MAFFGGRYRFFVLAIGFYVNMCVTLCVRNITFAVHPMTNRTAMRMTSAIPGDEGGVKPVCFNTTAADAEYFAGQQEGPFSFSHSDLAQVQAAHFAGQILGTLMALVVNDHFFAKPQLVTCLLWIAWLTLCTPAVTHWAGVGGLISARFCVGLYYGKLTPLFFTICRNWTAEKELNVGLAFLSTGSNVGALLFGAAGALVDAAGWEALFYLPGALTIVCVILVFTFYTEWAKENRFVTQEEKNLLTKPDNEEEDDEDEDGFGLRRLFENIKTFKWMDYILKPYRTGTDGDLPWYWALGALPYWAVLVGTFGYTWASESTLIYTVTYMQEVLGYSHSKTDMLTSVPTNIALFLLGPIGTKVADICVEKKYCSETTAVRVGAFLCGTTSLYFVLFAALDCELIDLLIVPLLLLSSLRSAVYFSVTPFFAVMHSTYRDPLYTTSMVMGYIPGVLVPYLMAGIGTHSRYSWTAIFLVSATVIALCFIFFAAFLPTDIYDETRTAELVKTKSIAQKIWAREELAAEAETESETEAEDEERWEEETKAETDDDDLEYVF